MDEIRLPPDALTQARQKLHPNEPITLSTESLKDADLSIRRRNFFAVERAIYRQRYLGTLVKEQPVNSCRMASAVIALARMGVVEDVEQTLARLEREIVESAMRTGHIASSGDTGPEVPYLIFTQFGLPTGFANDISQVVKALRAGGCVCFAPGGHSKCATEISPDGTQLKIFDPLQNISIINPLSIMADRVRISPGQVTTDAVLVYPQNYHPNTAKGEVFYPPGVVNNIGLVNFSPLPINTAPYKK
jgi:hypothetical protein